MAHTVPGTRYCERHTPKRAPVKAQDVAQVHPVPRPSVSHPQTPEHLQGCPECAQGVAHQCPAPPGAQQQAQRPELPQELPPVALAQGSQEPEDISPEMNAKRAHWAWMALAKFAWVTGLDLKAEGETALQDLLTDLQHWAQEQGINFPEVAERAERRYAEEIQGQAQEVEP